MIKKIWHDPVLSKVISSIIIFLGSLIIFYLVGLWSILGSFLQQISSLAVTKSNIQNWLLAFLGILTIWKLCDVFKKLFYRPTRPRDAFRSYRKDKIDGIVWRWNYANSPYGALYRGSVVPHCPKCGYELELVGILRLSDPIIFRCGRCNKNIRELKRSVVQRNTREKFINDIYLEIERRIRRKRKI